MLLMRIRSSIGSVAAFAVLAALAVIGGVGCGGESAPEPQASAPTAASPAPAPETVTSTAPETSSAPNVEAKAAPKATKYPAGARRGRVVILGFDGVEPTIVDAMFAANQLPNLAKLRDEGTYDRLTSSIPPQSPSAWSSFNTCRATGGHGIYDFVVRVPAAYRPDFGFGNTEHAQLSPDGALLKPAQFHPKRKGEDFWKEADSQGLKCTSLMVPFAFPADDLTQGHMLCGLGVPDVRNSDSHYFSFSDQYAGIESVAGGTKMPLTFEGDVAKISLPGVRDSRVTNYDAPEAFARVDVEFKVDRNAHAVSITTPSGTIEVKQDSWSPWVEWAFNVSPQFAVRAISRFYVLDAGEHVKIYMSCLQYHPKAPYMRFTTPETYGGELQDKYGLYKTIGWTYDTHALRQDDITDDIFLGDVAQTMSWYERLTLDELDANQYDLLISAWTGTDRVAHMFWRFRDPKHPLYTEEGAKKYGHAVEDTYLKMDDIVGKVMGKLATDDLLMVLSDHGFKSFRKGFNVNTWLVRNGYLTVIGQTDAATAHTAEKARWLNGFDWSKSRAYSVGLGAIFLNLMGREGQGTVDPADAEKLAAEIREKLLALTDPDTGDKVFDAVYTRDVFHGEAQDSAPDLQLGYADGYQSSKLTVTGAAPDGIFEINDDKWSGEHASSDTANTPGIFFANKKINTETPRIIDLGVTALQYLGASVPEDFDGEPLL